MEYYQSYYSDAFQFKVSNPSCLLGSRSIQFLKELKSNVVNTILFPLPNNTCMSLASHSPSALFSIRDVENDFKTKSLGF